MVVSSLSFPLLLHETARQFSLAGRFRLGLDLHLKSGDIRLPGDADRYGDVPGSG